MLIQVIRCCIGHASTEPDKGSISGSSDWFFNLTGQVKITKTISLNVVLASSIKIQEFGICSENRPTQKGIHLASGLR